MRVSLQVNDPNDPRPKCPRPYIVNSFVDYPEGDLEVDFLKPLESDGNYLQMPYDLSQKIPSRAIPDYVNSQVERVLNGRMGIAALCVSHAMICRQIRFQAGIPVSPLIAKAFHLILSTLSSKRTLSLLSQTCCV